MPEETTESASYICNACRAKFPRWLAVTTNDNQWVLHLDSLQYHFIMNKKCNVANAERMKEDRKIRADQEYHDYMDML